VLLTRDPFNAVSLAYGRVNKLEDLVRHVCVPPPLFSCSPPRLSLAFLVRLALFGILDSALPFSVTASMLWFDVRFDFQ